MDSTLRTGDHVRIRYLGAGHGVPKECDGVEAVVLGVRRGFVTVQWRRREVVERRPVPLAAVEPVGALAPAPRF
jgi:hypothetical protein